ncbi:glycosyltransferase family 39 protein [Microbispora sp. RL4-1S]|uniref:Glycosyltransferase family 39 protein n=1 Tax=Microbispora oryzae TaxID=2806554 RepID=A0A940WHA8_9ACTN|nr:glycosyltransferase family 39 protein [Microbispora oryzae]MBP2704798.1 glycosyltransferase family 39 protein [Microbispora oryzae]
MSVAPVGVATTRAARAPRARASAALAVPAVLALAAGLWEPAGPPVWRDEAATISAASRTLPETARLLASVDAVHGLYYAFAHVMVALFGPDPVALRLPSVVAGALAAAGVCALGRALGAPRAGLYGGCLLALMPIFSRYVQEARPYAFVLAAAVGATLLFVRALRTGSATAFAAYGVALAGLAYLNLYAALVPVAHGVSLLWSRSVPRASFLRWCAATAAVGAAVAPLAWLGRRQSAQVGWITRPDAGDVGTLAAQLFGDLGTGARPWLGLAPLVWALALAGLWRAARRSPSAGVPLTLVRLTLVRLALPWLLLPPAVLLAVSWTVHPVYVFRYVLYCVPAAALLAGAGLAAWPARSAVAMLVLAAGLSIPGQLATRGPDGRQDDPRPVMAVLAAARPGDGVLFVPRKVRKYAVVYPRVFGRLDDVGLRRSPRRDGSFGGRDVGRRLLPGRLTGVRTVWVIGQTGKAGRSSRRLGVVRRMFAPAGRWASRGLFLERYEAPSARAARPAGSAGPVSSNGAGVGK